MAESTGELKTMLQALMTRFDETKLAGDKHREAQIAFDTQVSSGLAHLRKQLDLTEADIARCDSNATHHHRRPPASATDKTTPTTTMARPKLLQ